MRGFVLSSDDAVAQLRRKRPDDCMSQHGTWQVGTWVDRRYLLTGREASVKFSILLWWSAQNTAVEALTVIPSFNKIFWSHQSHVNDKFNERPPCCPQWCCSIFTHDSVTMMSSWWKQLDGITSRWLLFTCRWSLQPMTMTATLVPVTSPMPMHCTYACAVDVRWRRLDRNRMKPETP